jgi:DNA-nicking Smr family endonuclease
MSYYEGQKNNKYKQEPDLILDFHGMTTAECKDGLDTILKNREHRHLRIIVGKGTRSQNGPVLPDFVRNYLTTHNIRFSQSKIQDGGEGALEVYLAR